ncbi:MAG: glycosyltransferase family 1 protein, partial [Patescibacteria group bacterium]
RWYSLAEQLEMPKKLLQYNLDLVHFPHFNVPLLYPKKFIATIHDITPYFFPGPNVKKSIIKKLGYNLVFGQGIKRAKKIITVSNHTKDNLLKFFKVKPEKIEVIYLGIGPEYKEINDQNKILAAKKAYNITKPFILYTGVWRDHKNLPNLIKAFDLVKSRYRLDYQLVLGGRPDPRYPEISLAIVNSPFKTDIIQPGFIQDFDLPLLYNAAEIFVLPSFCEGFGLVALESLACGTPVVASNSTSLPEILQDSAIYFNPNNPAEMAEIINRVLTDQELYINLKNRGLNQIKRFNWPACAEKTLKIYQTT